MPMAHTANAKPSERFGVLTTVIVLHLAALAVLLSQRGAPQLPLPPAGSLSVVSLNAEPPAPTAPPPPILPSKIAEAIETETQLEFSTETDADSLAASTAGCPTLQLVREAILADRAAVTSVLNSPPETRSIAEAVVLWNARWSESAGSVAAPLGAARAAVERSLAGVDRACLDEPITGPRLVPIPAGVGTMFVVFGSGSWTWREVLENRQAATLALDGNWQAVERGAQPAPDRN